MAAMRIAAADAIRAHRVRVVLRRDEQPIAAARGDERDAVEQLRRKLLAHRVVEEHTDDDDMQRRNRRVERAGAIGCRHRISPA
jgi:hypothetical protein